MNYYKLINRSVFVGVISQLDFLKYQHKHHILLSCDEESAQYVQFEDELYHANWMKPVTTDRFSYITVDVVSISEEEYNTLRKAIEVGKDIVVEQGNPEKEDKPLVDPIEEVTVEYVKTAKINEMKNICNKIIINGFDAILSDGKTHHFSLTAQDQLNLIDLSALVESGEKIIPYHADGEPFQFYSVDDIRKIIATKTSFKTYHTSYFNSLKSYIESLNSIENIASITYGIQIPIEYQSEVLLTLNN